MALAADTVPSPQMTESALTLLSAQMTLNPAVAGSDQGERSPQITETPPTVFMPSAQITESPK